MPECVTEMYPNWQKDDAMLPEHVANQLKEGKKVAAGTVLFLLR